MNSVENVNYPVIIVGYWIFDSNYKKSLPLTPDSFNLVCSPLEVEGAVAVF